MSFESILKEKDISIKNVSEGTEIPESTMFHALKSDFRSMKFESIIKICQFLDCLPHELTSIGVEKETQLEEYEKMIEYSFAELPKFTNEQKKHIADMLNGSMYNINIPPSQYLKIQVVDSNEYDSLGEKWGVNVMELFEEIRSLSDHQAYTIIKIVRDWWKKPDNERNLENIF